MGKEFMEKVASTHWGIEIYTTKSVEVIQHFDKSASGKVSKSTTLKVTLVLNGTEGEFTFLIDRDLLIYTKRFDEGWMIWGQDFDILWKDIRKDLLKRYPPSIPYLSIEVLTWGIMRALSGIERPIKNSYRWPAWIYSQVRTKWVPIK